MDNEALELQTHPLFTILQYASPHFAQVALSMLAMDSELYASSQPTEQSFASVKTFNVHWAKHAQRPDAHHAIINTRISPLQIFQSQGYERS